MNIYHICQNSENKFITLPENVELKFGDLFTDRPDIVGQAVQLNNRMTTEQCGVAQFLPDGVSQHKNVDIRKCNGCGTYIALETS